mgnify:FL=1|tara:strand:- start:437 stop:694 length:258 start_codon:yes stop_codon:yes gene_type:complete
MARNKMQTTTSGFGYLDGKPIGKRKFLVKGEFDVVMKEEVVLIAHDRESAEDRFIEFASKKAKQLGGELGTTFIDFAEDEAYFSG